MALRWLALACLATLSEAKALIRPGLGSGPDTVRFGIWVKKLFSIDMKKGMFDADLVQTFQWSDSRATVLIPPGQPSISMPSEKALTVLWMPDMSISNRDCKGYEAISSNVKVMSDGTIFKVERGLASMRTGFDVTKFPFDRQTLNITISSAAYLAEDVVLEPMDDPTLVGIDESTFRGKEYYLLSTHSTVYTESDVGLSKSRGVFSVEVHRNSMVYMSELFFPAFVVQSISWTIFYLPANTLYAIPRVTTGMITVLNSVVLQLKVRELLPIREGLAWIDVFQETCTILIFATLVFNVATECLAHTYEAKPLAATMAYELKFLFPALSCFCTIVLFLNKNSVPMVGMFMHLSLVVVLFGYAALNVYRHQTDHEDPPMRRSTAEDMSGRCHKAEAQVPDG